MMSAVDHNHHPFDMCHEERVQQTQAGFLMPLVIYVWFENCFLDVQFFFGERVSVSTFIPLLRVHKNCRCPMISNWFWSHLLEISWKAAKQGRGKKWSAGAAGGTIRGPDRDRLDSRGISFHFEGNTIVINCQTCFNIDIATEVLGMLDQNLGNQTDAPFQFDEWNKGPHN